MARHRRSYVRSLLTVAYAAILTMAVTSAAQKPSAAKQVNAADEAQFEHAMKLMDAGESAEAKPILETLNRRYPGKFEIAESLGLLYASAGDLQAALPLLQAGAHAAPDNAAAHANLGTAYLKLERTDSAVSELRRALALDASNAQTQNALGQALMLIKDPCKAASAFQAARAGALADNDLPYNTALALYDCGHYDEAATALDVASGATALEQSASAQSLLGDIDEKRGQFKEAAEHYLRATQLDPSESNTYVLGLDLLRHWSFDPAIKTLEDGMRRCPESRRMLSGLGIAYYGAARYSDAIKIFSKLLQDEPANAMYGEIFGRSCTVLTNSDDPQCLRLTELAEQYTANANLGLYAAISILNKPADAQDPKIAHDLLQNALRVDGRLATAHYELGVLLQQEDRWADSIAEMQKALELDPSLARAHYRLGLAYHRTGRKEDAQHEMAIDREEDQAQRNDLNARMQQITTLLVKMP